MNYLRPELLDLLTERFVVGTMTWRARRRFDRLIDEHDQVRGKVYELEATLSPAVWALPPVSPSDLVWRRICRDIEFGRSRTNSTKRSAWPAVASMLALALVASSFGWWQAYQKPPETIIETVTNTVTLEPSVAVINDDDGQPLWVALVYNDLQQVNIEVSTAPAVQTANDYELWIIGGDGTPVSMGLLPQTGDATLNIDAGVVAALTSGTTLAVSLEPLGGSPQPTPTGPVLYTAPLLTR